MFGLIFVSGTWIRCLVTIIFSTTNHRCTQVANLESQASIKSLPSSFEWSRKSQASSRMPIARLKICYSSLESLTRISNSAAKRDSFSSLLSPLQWLIRVGRKFILLAVVHLAEWGATVLHLVAAEIVARLQQWWTIAAWFWTMILWS